MSLNGSIYYDLVLTLRSLDCNENILNLYLNHEYFFHNLRRLFQSTYDSSWDILLLHESNHTKNGVLLLISALELPSSYIPAWYSSQRAYVTLWVKDYFPPYKPILKDETSLFYRNFHGKCSDLHSYAGSTHAHFFHIPLVRKKFYLKSFLLRTGEHISERMLLRP